MSVTGTLWRPQGRVCSDIEAVDLSVLCDAIASVCLSWLLLHWTIGRTWLLIRVKHRPHCLWFWWIQWEADGYWEWHVSEQVAATPDLMLAYIDVFLGGDEKRPDLPPKLMQRLPMTIVFGGEGSYMAPYTLHSDNLLTSLIGQVRSLSLFVLNKSSSCGFPTDMWIWACTSIQQWDSSYL